MIRRMTAPLLPTQPKLYGSIETMLLLNVLSWLLCVCCSARQRIWWTATFGPRSIVIRVFDNVPNVELERHQTLWDPDSNDMRSIKVSNQNFITRVDNYANKHVSPYNSNSAFCADLPWIHRGFSWTGWISQAPYKIKEFNRSKARYRKTGPFWRGKPSFWCRFWLAELLPPGSFCWLHVALWCIKDHHVNIMCVCVLVLFSMWNCIPWKQI
jgi:hypothetical protein